MVFDIFNRTNIENEIKFNVIWQTKKAFPVPKQLKGIKPFSKIKFEGKTINAYKDLKGDLWYKDNSVQVKTISEIVKGICGEEVKTTSYSLKQYVNFEGIHECINMHSLDLIRLMCEVSEKYYTGNTSGDNMRLERLYEQLLKEYLKSEVEKL